MIDPTTLCNVISVFDPDGNGGDFAYTVGLRDLGLPELHIHARPSDGDDPGADWMLSHRDRHSVLMRTVTELVEGRLEVGDEFVQTYDDGLATVTYRLDPPTAAEDCEAFMAAPADVVPIRWRLDRPPVGTPKPVDADTARAIEARLDLERATTTKICLLTGRAATTCAPDDGLELGPQADVVRCVAAQLEAYDGRFLNALLATMLAAHLGGWRDGYDRGLLAAHARVNGRQSAVDAARSLADRTVARLLGTTYRPRRLLRDVTREFGMGNDEQSWGVVIEMVTRFARTLLAAEAAADVLPSRLYLSATTARDVLLADRNVRALPGERIHLDTATQRALRSSIGSLTLEKLRPYLSALKQLSADEIADWSLGILRAEFDAAHSCRALPSWSELFGSTSPQGQIERTRLVRTSLAEEGVELQPSPLAALSRVVRAFALWAAMPADADPDLRAVLERPIPEAMLDNYRSVEAQIRNTRAEDAADGMTA